MVRPSIAVVFSLLLAFFSVAVVEARDRLIQRVQPDKGKYLTYNVGLTSVFTLVGAMVQHQVKSPRDIARHLLAGAGAGAGFYEAKRIAGAGRTTEGWIIANAVSTVVENTVSGERAFGRIGYTVGPFRIRFATPFAKKAVARVEADWSVAETIFLVLARHDGDHVRIRHGLIAVDRDTPWPTKDLNGFFGGRTNGVFPGVSPGQPSTTWWHETIHAIQCQQIDSLEPPAFPLDGNPDRPAPQRLFAFGMSILA
jgi:hypothetical protein